MPTTRRTGRIVLVLVLVLAAVAITALAGCSSDSEPALGTTTITTGGVDVNAIVREPDTTDQEGDYPAPTVLFLHGQSYSSRIWDDRGILDDVAADGYRAVAVDLPGYGDTPERPTEGTRPISDADWLAGLIDELGGPTNVVMVSPSMSGTYSLPYLVVHPDDELAGFVPVAPVDIDGFVRPPNAAAIPSLIVWGSEDEAYTEERTQILLDELGESDLTQVEVIEGGSHAAYDDHPDEFTTALRAFLGTLPPVQET